MVTDPARKRRTDPGNPDICPVFDLHRIFTPDAAARGRARTGCRTAGIGCLDCKDVLLQHMLPPLAAIRERRQAFAEKPDRDRRDPPRGLAARAQRSPEQTMDEVRDAVQARRHEREVATRPGDLTLRVGSLRGAARSPAPSLPHQRDRPRPRCRCARSPTSTWPTSRRCEFRDLETAGAFLVMAATLIYLKSKLLVPADRTTPTRSWTTRASCSSRSWRSGCASTRASRRSARGWPSARRSRRSSAGAPRAELPPPEDVPLEDLSRPPARAGAASG